LVVINKIPALQLRLADEDEIIGTDWAQMGERAYGYLPFYEGSESPRRSNEDEGSSQTDEESVIENNNTDAVAAQKKRATPFKKLRKLLKNDRNAVINRVPDLIEESVLDYGQKKDHRDGGSIRLRDMPTGRDLLQINRPTPSTSQASSGIVMVEVENASSTVNEGSSSSASSSEKLKDRA
jgi:Amt family ammonium transporter